MIKSITSTVGLLNAADEKIPNVKVLSKPSAIKPISTYTLIKSARRALNKRCTRRVINEVIPMDTRATKVNVPVNVGHISTNRTANING